jgi:hypothetical protein
MRNSSHLNQLKQFSALMLALASAWAIGAFVQPLVPYALALACITFAILWWRKRGTSNDFAIRFGVASFALALLAISLRIAGLIGHAAA